MAVCVSRGNGAHYSLVDVKNEVVLGGDRLHVVDDGINDAVHEEAGVLVPADLRPGPQELVEQGLGHEAAVVHPDCEEGLALEQEHRALLKVRLTCEPHDGESRKHHQC